MKNQSSILVQSLADLMAQEFRFLHGVRRISKDLKNGLLARATTIVQQSCANSSLRTFEFDGKLAAFAALHDSASPRIENQQSLFLIYDRKLKRQTAKWIKKTITELAADAPRYSQMTVHPSTEDTISEALRKSGFKTRFEVLSGDTATALKNLVRKKKPEPNLNHLGLDIRVLSRPAEVEDVIRLQKRVSLKSKNHGYFSHTPGQLASDKREYAAIIAGISRGRIIGVYKKKKLAGVMIAIINNGPPKTGGFSFFLDSSIQGLGIAKTGYLLLLQFLLENKTKTFRGGTSQPAVQGLGKVMKREVQQVIYVKTS